VSSYISTLRWVKRAVGARGGEEVGLSTSESESSKLARRGKATMHQPDDMERKQRGNRI
jgi:hypothetical protein